MPLITLTTDWGLKDSFVGALKGAILTDCSSATIVDITHGVPLHDITEAAYIFKHASKHFPPGTVHLISIENHQVGLAPILIILLNKQYYIGPDSGIFSMIFSKPPADMVRIKAPLSLRQTNTSHILARTAAYLANGGDMYQVGEKTETFTVKYIPNAVLEGNLVRTTVIYIDHFGNVVLNLDAGNFQAIGKSRSFTILLKREQIEQAALYSHYSEVEDGEILCLLNAGGMLEIAINNGNASRMLGIKTGDTIRLEFHDHQNR